MRAYKGRLHCDLFLRKAWSILILTKLYHIAYISATQRVPKMCKVPLYNPQSYTASMHHMPCKGLNLSNSSQSLMRSKHNNCVQLIPGWLSKLPQPQYYPSYHCCSLRSRVQQHSSMAGYQLLTGSARPKS